MTKKSVKKKSAKKAAVDPVVAPGSPKKFRVRVRMYRQGLGDCFLITFPRKGKNPFQILVDCGVLARDSEFMTRIVRHIRDTVRNGKTKGKARLDVVVATHEHKDHLSGFNQARDVFNKDFEFGAVWLGWTENLTKPEIKK
jgi:glyoxylase-like metal-dependent hydrolase (beta-lactamase superfamily II)